jgi:hypothetical protein
MLVYRTGKGTDANDIAFDLCHLGDCSHGSLADHRPGPFADERRIRSPVEEAPRQAGIIPKVEHRPGSKATGCM